jgi:hypothetical protein
MLEVPELIHNILQSWNIHPPYRIFVVTVVPSLESYPNRGPSVWEMPMHMLLSPCRTS